MKHGVLDPFCSDHKPIYARLNSIPHSQSAYKILLWDFNNSNFEIFRMKSREVDWVNILDDVCWCLTSHRQRGHSETAPPFTVPCEGREAR